MAATRVILVSDSHLSESAPQARANWDAVVAHVGARRPDLVIHLGDLSLDGTRDACRSRSAPSLRRNRNSSNPMASSSSPDRRPARPVPRLTR